MLHTWKIQVLSYLSGAWRYRWWALGLAWIACLGGWIGVATMPDQFQSEAKVYIDTDSLILPLLKGLTVNNDSQQEIDVMMRTLITRPNIEQVIKLTDPNAAKLKPADLEEQVTQLQRAINLRPLGAKNLFAISYRNNNPSYAQAVVQSLVSILVNTNLGDKRRDVEGVQSFIDEQVSNYERVLRETEKRRADFRVANVELNGTLTASAKLDRAQGNVESAKDQLDAAVTRRDSLRAQMQKTPPILQVDAASPVIINGDSRPVPITALQAAIQRLDDMKFRYTDEHPDVIAQKKLIDHLRAETPAARAAAAAADGAPAAAPNARQQQGISNPAYVSLQSKLTDEETAVALQVHRLEDAKTSVEILKKQMAAAITVERQYSDLDRDYEAMHKNYQDLLSRREQARMSQAVGDQQSTMVFRTVEPPQRAQIAVAPNRMLMNSFVLAGGILAGIGFAFLLSINAGSFIISDQLISAMNVPVIGVVSRVRRAADLEASRKSLMAMAAGTGALAVCYVIVLFVLHANFRTVLGGII